MAVTEDYLKALGQITWTYAVFEWNVICILDRLVPNYTSTSYRLPKKPTSRTICNDFKTLVYAVSDQAMKRELEGVLNAFEGCINHRNDFVHANPATGSSGYELLARMKQGPTLEWTIERLSEFNARFDAASRLASATLHGPALGAYAPKRS